MGLYHYPTAILPNLWVSSHLLLCSFQVPAVTNGSIILMVNLPGERIFNEELLYTSSIQTAFSPGFT
jgi:hypothetical protein